MSPSHQQTPSEKLTQKQTQLTRLHNIISSIYIAHSEKELYDFIKNQLPQKCQVDSIKLSYDKKLSKPVNHIHIYSGEYSSNKYFIYYYKEIGFSRTEKLFLNQVGTAISSALQRIEQYHKLQNQKEQWELAFDAIATAICFTDLQNRILRTNKTFRDKTNLSKQELQQKNYFQTFFGPHTTESTPQPNGKKTRIKRHKDNKKEWFEVSVQKITQKTKQAIQLVILRDITEQIKIETKIAQSVKTAELGIISSSVAHELNNPIGGIYTLLEIIQDKNTNKDISQDLKEMSLATKRCLNIIDRLLNAHR